MNRDERKEIRRAVGRAQQIGQSAPLRKADSAGGGGDGGDGYEPDTTTRSYLRLAVVTKAAVKATHSGKTTRGSLSIHKEVGEAVPLVDRRTLYDPDDGEPDSFCSSLGTGLADGTVHPQSGIIGGGCLSFTDAVGDGDLVMLPATSYAEGTVEIAAGVVTLSGGTWPEWVLGSDDSTTDPAVYVHEDGKEYAIESRDSDTQVTLEDTSLTDSTVDEYLVKLKDNVVTFSNTDKLSGIGVGALVTLSSNAAIKPDSTFRNEVSAKGVDSDENKLESHTLSWDDISGSIEDGDLAILFTLAMDESGQPSAITGTTEWVLHSDARQTVAANSRIQVRVARCSGTESGTFTVTMSAGRCTAAVLRVIKGHRASLWDWDKNTTAAKPMTLPAAGNPAVAYVYTAAIVVDSDQGTFTSIGTGSEIAGQDGASALNDGGDEFHWFVAEEEVTLADGLENQTINHNGTGAVRVALSVCFEKNELDDRPDVVALPAGGAGAGSLTGVCYDLIEEIGAREKVVYSTIDSADRDVIEQTLANIGLDAIKYKSGAHAYKLSIGEAQECALITVLRFDGSGAVIYEQDYAVPLWEGDDSSQTEKVVTVMNTVPRGSPSNGLAQFKRVQVTSINDSDNEPDDEPDNYRFVIDVACG